LTSSPTRVGTNHPYRGWVWGVKFLQIKGDIFLQGDIIAKVKKKEVKFNW
jgi:hypothetical protein